MGEQWKIKKRYNTLTNQQKRLFHHFHLMHFQSKLFAQDPESDFNGPPAWRLNTFVNLAKSIGRIEPGGCWIVKKDVERLTTGRPGTHLFNTVLKTTARVVCFFNYGSQALKGVQASHLCNNSDCVKPLHIFPEPATANERRDKCFKVGCTANCECVPTCLFLRDGRQIICRSNGQLIDCQCDSEKDCFEEGKFFGIIFELFGYYIFSDSRT